jgi:hypothetical protein
MNKVIEKSVSPVRRKLKPQLNTSGSILEISISPRTKPSLSNLSVNSGFRCQGDYCFVANEENTTIPPHLVPVVL